MTDQLLEVVITVVGVVFDEQAEKPYVGTYLLRGEVSGTMEEIVERLRESCDWAALQDLGGI